MPDNLTLTTDFAATIPVGTVLATDQLPDGSQVQKVKVLVGTADSATPVIFAETANGLKVDGSAVVQPVSGPLTDTQLRAGPVAITGTVTATVTDGSGPLTVDGTVAISSASTDAVLTAGTAKAQITDGVRTAGITDGTTASNESTQDRLKVNAELRAIDPTQAAGAQVVALPGSRTQGLLVSLAPNTLTDLLAAILTELKINNSLLQSGLNVRDDLDNMRADPYFLQ